MKFFGAILAYLVIGAILAWGIYLLVTKGNYWVMGIGTLGYVLAFIKFGCLPPKKSH